MNSIDYLVQRYDADHTNIISRAFRLMGILSMNFALFCFLWSLPNGLIISWLGENPYANWATVYAVLMVIYYGSESFSLTFGAGSFLLGSIVGTFRIMYYYGDPLMPGLILLGSSALFFVIGRLISKSMNKLYRDITYLPIQPVWIINHLYKLIGISI